MAENTTFDYSDFKESPTNCNVFAPLHQMVDEARTRQKEIERLTALLEQESEKQRNLLWFRLPAKMKELGITEFKTTDGLDIKVEEKIEASLSEERRSPAIKWLDENGHGALVKREVTVAFNRDQQHDAEQLLKELNKWENDEGEKVTFASIAEKKNVHHSTLKAWVKEMSKTGKPFPRELFGARTFEVATIPNLKQNG